MSERLSPPRPSIRLSDAERQTIVDDLGRHLTDGRLSIHEFDERVAQVYRATTEHEAVAVLADLPATPSPAAPRTPHLRRETHRSRLPLHLRIEWAAWLVAGAVNVAVWTIVSLGTDTPVHPWPVWVVVPWGIVLAVRTMSGLEHPRGGSDHIRTRRARSPLHDAHVRRALAYAQTAHRHCGGTHHPRT